MHPRHSVGPLGRAATEDGQYAFRKSAVNQIGGAAQGSTKWQSAEGDDDGEGVVGTWESVGAGRGCEWDCFTSRTAAMPRPRPEIEIEINLATGVELITSSRPSENSKSRIQGRDPFPEGSTICCVVTVGDGSRPREEKGLVFLPSAFVKGAKLRQAANCARSVLVGTPEPDRPKLQTIHPPLEMVGQAVRTLGQPEPHGR